MPQLMSRSAGTADATQVANDVRPSTLEGFLAGIERRALRMAEFVTRDRDEALDNRAGRDDEPGAPLRAETLHRWPPLFYRILDNRIRDWQRRQSVKRRIFFWNEQAAG